jgi:hypothetical protein
MYDIIPYSSLEKQYTEKNDQSKRLARLLAPLQR